MDNGINAKQDIKDFGEVFTPDKIVNDMLDLVKEQIQENEEYITKTFLEPACGDGQFLVRILYRKLKQVEKLPIEQRQLALVKALSSIYGVDIQEKNVDASRKRMKALLLGREVTTFGRDKETDKLLISDLGVDIAGIEKVIDYILDTNIIIGNTLEETQFSDDYVWLTSYDFDADNNGGLTIAKRPIGNPDWETNKEHINHYTELADRYNGDPIDIDDIAERYKDFPLWNENKTEEKPKSTSISSKKNQPTWGEFNL